MFFVEGKNPFGFCKKGSQEGKKGENGWRIIFQKNRNSPVEAGKR